MYKASGKIIDPQAHVNGILAKWRLDGTFKHPEDNYLWFCLLSRDETNVYVTYLYNGQEAVAGLHHGHYFRNRNDAALDFIDRCASLLRLSRE